MRQRITCEESYINKKFNNIVKSHKCIGNIVEGYLQRLEHMTKKHGQTSVMQFMVRPAESTPADQCNKVIGECLRSVKKTKENNGIEIQAGWVREISEEASKGAKAQRCHYHIGAIVDAKKCQSAVGIAKQMKKLLEKRAQGEADAKTVSVRFAVPLIDEQDLATVEKASAIKIRRDKPRAAEQFENAYDWLKYPARAEKQKGGLPSGRGYGFTALPKE